MKRYLFPIITLILLFTAGSCQELTVEEAFEVVKSHLQKSFSSVLLFTTTKDVIFKVNKKGAGSFSEGPPTFSDAIPKERD